METTPKTTGDAKPKAIVKPRAASDKPSPRWINDISPEHRRVLEEIERYMRSLGDDVERKNLKLYIAFTRLTNFATVVCWRSKLMLYLHLDPTQIQLEAGFSRDVRNVGHWGTGDLALYLKSLADLEKAKLLIRKAHGLTYL